MVSDGWALPAKDNVDDDDFEHYAKKDKKAPTVIIPPDFEELIPMQKSERANQYTHIIKRLIRHSKLKTLASACKVNPKAVEKALEKCFLEMKNVMKTR